MVAKWRAKWPPEETCLHNPYSAPNSGTLTPVDTAAQELRTQHIVVESNLNSIGGLTILLGGLMVLGSVLPLVLEGGAIGGLLGLLVGGLTLLWGILLRMRCCRRLSRWTSLLWLPVFPLGTLIGGYVFWALSSAHGEVLFSPQYREVVAQTLHIRAPTPMVVRVVVGLFIVLLLWRFLTI